MKINYNAAAMMAVNALNRNDENVSVSTGKLSSGYKINRAKDNPSGYAMSRKMRAQLDGLLQARDNTDTGVNIIKAVDGALSEVHDMLQRMNELAIKGANGALSDGDRELVDEEVQKLKEEVQRISETFEFNGQKLLDGSFQLKGYVELNGDQKTELARYLSIKVAGYNDRMRVGMYTFDLSGFKNTEITDDAGNTIKKLDLYDKNGNFIAENVYDLWREKVTVPGYQLADDGSLALRDPSGKTNAWGTLGTDGVWKELEDKTAAAETKPAVLDPETDPEKKQEGWGYIDDTWKALPQDWKETTEVVNPNRNRIPDPKQDTIVKVIGPDEKPIEPLYVSDANGTVLTLKGPNGFEIKLDITEDFLEKDKTATGKNKEKIKINLTGLGAMTIQVGANEGQELKMEVPGTGVKELGIDLIKTTTKEDSLEAITRVGVAIGRLSGIRSKLGAYQNRMESIVASNEINHENMSAAYSGILDTDMSEEYTKYSTYQVLSQASTSVLAQANKRPAQVLQLLQ